jgi:hypothetical protein
LMFSRWTKSSDQWRDNQAPSCHVHHGIRAPKFYGNPNLNAKKEGNPTHVHRLDQPQQGVPQEHHSTSLEFIHISLGLKVVLK